MKQALVIGAQGGIGAAVVQELGERGFAVTEVSRKRDGLDVTDEASVARVMGALEGPFDLVFVAVGTLAAGGAPEKSLAGIEATQMVDVFKINALGPALVLGQVGRLLPRDRRSVVAVLSARVGSIGDNHLGGWHSYRASKAAVNQVVRGAAIEMKRKRAEAVVVALHPGTVRTDFTANYRGHSMVEPAEAAANLCNVMEGLGPEQTGQFFDYAGRVVPW